MKSNFSLFCISFLLISVSFCCSCQKNESDLIIKEGVLKSCKLIKERDIDFDEKQLRFDYANCVISLNSKACVYYEIFSHRYVCNSETYIYSFYYSYSYDENSPVKIEANDYYYIRWSIADKEIDGFFKEYYF